MHRTLIIGLLLGIWILSTYSCNEGNDRIENERFDESIRFQVILHSYIKHLDKQESKLIRHQPVIVGFYEDGRNKVMNIYTSMYPPEIIDSNLCFVMKGREKNHEIYIIDYSDNPIGSKFYATLNDSQKVDCNLDDRQSPPPYRNIQFPDDRWRYKIVGDSLTKI